MILLSSVLNDQEKKSYCTFFYQNEIVLIEEETGINKNVYINNKQIHKV